MRILIVDDNPSIRRVIRSIVEDLASEIHDCEDPAEVIAMYASCQPDVVLMDIALGEMNGITLTSEIRAADPAAKIIIVTNYDHADLREAARAAGACAYTLKENLFEVRLALLSLAPGQQGGGHEI
jgi:CheY-like chemotaxis protein